MKPLGGWHLLAALFAVASCEASTPARVRAPGSNDPFDKVAVEELASPCAALPSAGNVPSLPDAGSDPQQATNYDVVAYLAHPHDEAIYISGTLAKLSRAHRRVAVVFMSHGEGGRLLEVNKNGEFVERYDVPSAEIAATRDGEVQKESALLGFEASYLYPAEAVADFGKTLSCADSLRRWDDKLPDGVGGILRRLVTDIRSRRPHVIVTHDPRDDPHWMDHGHNKALGALVEMAARMAADPAFGTGQPHVVEELLSISPLRTKPDVTIAVANDMRMQAIAEYPSQFRPDKAAELARQTTENFTLRWRATGGVVPPSGSVLGNILGPAPGRAP